MSFYKEIDSDFCIQKGSYGFWPTPTPNEMHFHNCYEMYYLLEGSIWYLIENNIYSIESGKIAWIPPNILHKTKPNASESYKKIMFTISPKYLKKIIGEDTGLNDFFSKTRVITMTEQDKADIEAILVKLIDICAEDAPSNELLIKSYLGVLIFTLSKSSTASKNSLFDEDKDVPESIRGIVRYLNEHYSEDITLETLSNTFYLHQNYICNLITKTLGVSFRKYLNKIRIANSMDLLQATDKSISDIASDCGFSSSTNYCREFKLYFNISPSRYRKSYQAKL